jgi:hypothetical protein
MNPRETRIVIAGLARNVRPYLPYTLNWMTKLQHEFHPDSQLLFFTNDSSDGTVEYLQNIQAADPTHITILREDGLHEKKPLRTVRIAHCRNAIMSHIHTHFADYDLLILADMDNVTIGVRPTMILDCLRDATSFKWDMLSANSQPTYYDVWALRSRALGINYDCWDKAHHAQNNGMSKAEAVSTYVSKWQRNIPASTPPIPVESAFCGLAIYKIASTRDCIYDGVKHTYTVDRIGWEEACEHVSFHADMIAKHNAKLFIYPQLVLPLLRLPLNA